VRRPLERNEMRRVLECSAASLTHSLWARVSVWASVYGSSRYAALPNAHAHAVPPPKS
jgi:hypothetical protein